MAFIHEFCFWLWSLRPGSTECHRVSVRSDPNPGWKGIDEVVRWE